MSNNALEIRVPSHSRSLKVVPFNRLPMVSYSNFVPEIFDFKNAPTLKTWLVDRQGHWKCHHSIEHMRLPIDVL